MLSRLWRLRHNTEIMLTPGANHPNKAQSQHPARSNPLSGFAFWSNALNVQMANPRGQQRDKPFREALRLEISEIEDNPRSLRLVARKLLDQAVSGDVQAIKEVADRLDGKPAQAITGEDGGAISVIVQKFTDG